MGAAAGNVWRALGWKVSMWNAGYLNESAGEEWVYASCLSRGDPRNFGFAPQRRLMRFRQLLDKRRKGAPCYLNTQGMKAKTYQPPLHRALATDVPVPALLPLLGRKLDRVTLWMGSATDSANKVKGADEECSAQTNASNASGCVCGSGAGHMSRFHHDTQDNVLAVMEGEKHYTLFPPWQASNLYTVGEIARIDATGRILYTSDVGHGNNHGVHFSLVPNVFQPSDADLERFPRLRHAMPEGGRVTLGPGELLFIPAGWFHQVRSCCTHSAINFWWNV